jgi:hypothetical protein
MRAGFVTVAILSVGLSGGFAFLLEAQTAIQSTIADIRALAAAEPAVSKTIPVVANPPSSPPGTYWSLQLADQAPLPFCPFLGLQIIEITNGVYVFDDRGVDYSALSTQQAAKPQTMAAKSVVAEGGTGNSAALMDVADGSGAAFSFPNDQLWLQIAGVSSNRTQSYLVIHTPEVNAVYDLFRTTNLNCRTTGLNGTNWEWVLRSNPGQTNLTITNITTGQCFFRLGRTNDTDGDGLSDAFEILVSHTDLNNADQNSNSIPDGWEWANFGSLQPGDGDYDGDGLSNYQEYLVGADPNTILFEVNFDNFNVSADVATGIFSVVAGVPARMAVLVDSTNFAAASWVSYSSMVPVNLGSIDGPRNVWIGLKGRTDSSRATWEEMQLTRSTAPPSIVVTNPVAATLTTPLIQLQGYCPKPLRSLRYDVTNAAASDVDQLGAIVQLWFDTNLFEVTTNWFQCYDIRLTNGVNTVVLRATDLAGNTSTNVYTYILDYALATNSPVLKLYWPQDGFQICDDHFDWRGWVDDASASVTGWIATTNGATNSFSGKVERNGNLWVENLPLAAGTNFLTLMVTNSAGRGCVTNISVLRNDLVLTMDPITDNLWQPTVNVTGFIGDASYSIWINGVKATVNADGTWSAANVPVTEGGTASFETTAYAPGDPQPPGGGQ